MTQVYFRISKAAYIAISKELGESAVVFTTVTDMDGTMPGSGGEQRIVTEWGWSSADTPIIRYEKRGDREYFSLIAVSES